MNCNMLNDRQLSSSTSLAATIDGINPQPEVITKPDKASSRMAHLDVIRGVTMLLVVAYHWGGVDRIFRA